MSDHYFAAEVASAAIKRCSPRIYRSRLIGLNAVRHEVRSHMQYRQGRFDSF